MNSDTYAGLFIFGGMVTLALIDSWIMRRWVKFDRSRGSWMRLIVHETIAYGLLMLALLALFAYSEHADFFDVLSWFDWPLTLVNLALGLGFKWLLEGRFRRPKTESSTMTDGSRARTDIAPPVDR
jgi:hypothetical protein